MISMRSSDGLRLQRKVFFLVLLLCISFGAQQVQAQLKPKDARKLITRMAGFELTSGSVRVKAVSANSAGTTEATAEVRFVFKLEKDGQGIWRVAEIRTGPGRWEKIGLIANALNTEGPTNECAVVDAPFRGAAAIDPSMKRSRCLLGSLLGIDLPSDALRIQEVDPFVIPLAQQPSALVIAWVKIEVQLAREEQQGLQVTALRTGQRDWVRLAPLLAKLNELKQSTARADLELMASALDKFRAERGFYVVSDKHAVAIDQLTPHYLPRVVREDPWNKPYRYQGDRDHFTLSSTGPDGKEDTADDIKRSN